MEELIFGINPVLETLKSDPGRIHTILLLTGHLKGKKQEIYLRAREKGIKIQLVPHSKFTGLVGEEAHQGVVGFVSPYQYKPLESLIEVWRASGEKALFLILDGIEDPRNFGALARTANTVGTHGVIIPKHRSASITSAATKAAAGAFAYTPVCRVPNLVAALEVLKKEGIWIVGTAADARQSLYHFDFNLDLALVVGNEGRGVHALVKKHCDFLLSIPVRREISSLNASVAGGVVLYEAIRQRHFKNLRSST